MCQGMTYPKLPTIIDLIDRTADTVELAVKCGYIVFWNTPIAKNAPLQPLIGYTYDREHLQMVDVVVMMKQLEIGGGTGEFALIVPTGFSMPIPLKGIHVAYSDSLLYPDGVHGDAVLMIEHHPNTQEAMHIAVARGFTL